jgi:hypothetical protein
LFAITEQYAVHVREAVTILAEELRNVADVGVRHSSIFSSHYTDASATRGAWALVNTYLLRRAAASPGNCGSLREAESWFLGSAKGEFHSLAAVIPSALDSQATEALSALGSPSEVRPLLPYLLSPHRGASRLTVLRDPTTKTALDTKRREGSFYTPRDVADYLVDEVFRELEIRTRNVRVLDPAAGTGVFLVSTLRHLAEGGDEFERAVTALHAFDTDATALDSAVFVLLHECLPRAATRGLSPVAAWNLLRLNMLTVDATRVRRAMAGDTTARPSTASLRGELWNNRVPRPLCEMPSTGDPSLPELFPNVSTGFDAVIGNPPYSDAASPTAALFSSGRSSDARLNTYPMFIRLMWEFTKPGRNASGLVVPLSVSYHQGAQYAACRASMSANGGRWRCAFFDREPHALFGEDVKTRSAILLRVENDQAPGRGSRAEVETTGLLKWRSGSRRQLFESLRFTSLGRVEIRRGIPKLGSPEERDIYRLLRSRIDPLGDLVTSISAIKLAELPTTDSNHEVFVGKTAYNFLNVFRSVPASFNELNNLSATGAMRLCCNDSTTADAVFAVLSSQLVYWLWRVEGDGFHLMHRFLEGGPLGRIALSGPRLGLLAKYGKDLWLSVKNQQVWSVNGRRSSIAFSPVNSPSVREAIDRELLIAAGLPADFAVSLSEIVRTTIAARRA